MPYLTIASFKLGLDTRRSELAEAPGSLVRLENGFINQGGEIEKSKAFTPTLHNMGDLGRVVTFDGMSSSEGPAGVWPTNHGLVPGLAGLYCFYDSLYVTDPVVVYYTTIYGTNVKVYCVPLRYATAHTTASVDGWTSWLGQPIILVTDTLGGRHMFFINTAGSWEMDMTAAGGVMLDPKALISLRGRVMVLSENILNYTSLTPVLGGAGPKYTWWTNTSGGTPAGYFNLLSSSNYSGASYSALALFQGNLAAFGDTDTQLWTPDADPTKWNLRQVFQGVGAVGSLGITSLGELDLLYTSSNSISSLRVRDSSLNAFVSDLGTPITSLVTDFLTNSASDFSKIRGVMEPGLGRYWMLLGQTIWVLSYYPTLKITAWSKMTGRTVGIRNLGAQNVWYPMTINEMVLYKGYIFARASLNKPTDPKEYLVSYGTIRKEVLNGAEDLYNYNADPLVFETPWLDCKKPGHYKMARGVDAIFKGTWKLEACSEYNINDTAALSWVTIFDGSTQPTPQDGRIGYSARGTHFKFRATCLDSGQSTFTSLIFHYDEASEK